jgi:hypothetical protein
MIRIRTQREKSSTTLAYRGSSILAGHVRPPINAEITCCLTIRPRHVLLTLLDCIDTSHNLFPLTFGAIGVEYML